MKLARRIILFACDWWEETTAAWSLARMRDCERNGGHQWGAFEDSAQGRLCRRCGALESSETSALAAWTSATSTSWLYRAR